MAVYMGRVGPRYSPRSNTSHESLPEAESCIEQGGGTNPPAQRQVKSIRKAPQSAPGAPVGGEATRKGPAASGAWQSHVCWVLVQRTNRNGFFTYKVSPITASGWGKASLKIHP